MTKKFYHVEILKDLHFYFCEVNHEQRSAWVKFGDLDIPNNSSYNDTKYTSRSKTFYTQGADGMKNLISSLDAREISYTSYIAYFSNTISDTPEIPKIHSVEMSLMVFTSDNCPLVVHMGIFRSPTYTGDIHKNISMMLHGQAAKTMISINSSKLYMISAPIDTMREKFYDLILDYPDSVWLTPGITQPDPYLEKNDEELNKIIKESQLCKSKLLLAKQALNIKSKPTLYPLVYEDDILHIKDQNSQIVHSIPIKVREANHLVYGRLLRYTDDYNPISYLQP